MKFEGMSLKKSFWRFIWPSVVAQWIFALYTMVDGMFVARGVSEVALSAVNIASPFVNFLFSVSILFAVGTSTIVAIFLGQENHREANRAYTQNLVVLGGISLVIMAAVWLSLDRIAAFLGATAGAWEASFTGFPYQASASSRVTNPLYTAPGNPCTCFWQSGQL